MNECAVCEAPFDPAVSGWALTCSDDHHERFVRKLEDAYGAVQRVTSLHTGKTHLVPTRSIVERGLRHDDLPQYPEENNG